MVVYVFTHMLVSEYVCISILSLSVYTYTWTTYKYPQLNLAIFP